MPYELHASAQIDARKGTVTLTFANTGRAAAVFDITTRHLDRAPRRYVVEPGKALRGDWAALADDGGKYDLWMHGPHGYRRRFTGDLAHWYDFVVTADSGASFSRRVAGRVETGRHSVSGPAMGLTGSLLTALRPPDPSAGRAPGAARSDPAETPARRGSNIRGIGGAALISGPRKCSVLRPVRVKLRQAAFNNEIFANLAHTTRG